MSEVKERPVLFSAPMVNAILKGCKSQTRRTMKPQPFYGTHLGGMCGEFEAWAWCPPSGKRYGRTHFATSLGKDRFDPTIGNDCPYGTHLHRLWVRETFFCNSLDYPEATEHAKENMVYRADNPVPDFEGESVQDAGGWRSPIHMPRWASRITLEIYSVRVERLNDISEVDAKAEGVDNGQGRGFALYPGTGAARGPLGYRKVFEELWETIHGPGSWALNPWVWVIQFRRIAQP